MGPIVDVNKRILQEDMFAHTALKKAGIKEKLIDDLLKIEKEEEEFQKDENEKITKIFKKCRKELATYPATGGALAGGVLGGGGSLIIGAIAGSGLVLGVLSLIAIPVLSITGGTVLGLHVWKKKKLAKCYAEDKLGINDERAARLERRIRLIENLAKNVFSNDEFALDQLLTVKNHFDVTLQVYNAKRFAVNHEHNFT